MQVVRIPSQGAVVGSQKFLDGCNNKIYSFKGIPYAKPPIGPLRWCPAQPANSWRGERLAIDFMPSAMQHQCSRDYEGPLYSSSFQSSEDCLYLNVWTPHDVRNGDIHLPVMVWFHGGGLISGSSSLPLYDGKNLAGKGVVVVTVNYRLGIFGYFSHPNLSEESSEGVSGNYGLTDQIEALKWVQKNISAFGGDPANVTIAGESAGALSVSQMLISPLSRGLFSKAILESAYLPPMPNLKTDYLDLPSAESLGVRFEHSLNLSKNGSDSIRSLRDLTAADILAASEGFEFDTAVVDGWALKEQVYQAFENDRQYKVPVIMGCNADEGSYLLKYNAVTLPKSKKNYRTEVKRSFGSLAEKFLEVYPESDLERAAYQSLGDGLYRWGTEKLARLMARSGAPVYLYRFCYAMDWAKEMGLGAFHFSEIPFVFNNTTSLDFSLPNWPITEMSEKDKSMASVVSSFWVSFCESGSPSVADQGFWAQFDELDKHQMIFDRGLAQISRMEDEAVFELNDQIIEIRKAERKSWSYKNLGLQAIGVFD